MNITGQLSNGISASGVLSSFACLHLVRTLLPSMSCSTLYEVLKELNLPYCEPPIQKVDVCRVTNILRYDIISIEYS